MRETGLPMGTAVAECGAVLTRPGSVWYAISGSNSGDVQGVLSPDDGVDTALETEEPQIEGGLLWSL